MAKFDSFLCYCHGNIHKFKVKRWVDQHEDSVTHKLRVQSSFHWHSVWTYSTGMASGFALLWYFFYLINGTGTIVSCRGGACL